LSFNNVLLERLPVALRKPVRNGVLAGFIAGALSLLIPNQYRSEVHILPSDSRGGGGSIGSLASTAEAMGVSVPGQEGSSDSAFVDILNSRWMAKKLLSQQYQFKTKGWLFANGHEHRESLSDFIHAKNTDRAILKFKKILIVNRDTKTRLLTISANTTSPELSQQIVQNSTATLEAFIESKGRTRGSNKAIFTEVRMREAQAAVAKAEQDALEFLEAHRNYATSNEPGIRLKGAQLDATLKLHQQVLTTLTLNNEQALLEEKNDMPILNILDDGDLPQEKSGPPRGTILLLAFLLVGGGSWLLPYLRDYGKLDPAVGTNQVGDK